MFKRGIFFSAIIVSFVVCIQTAVAKTEAELCEEAFIAEAYGKAFSLCLMPAKGGDARSQAIIGYMYLSGEGVAKDLAKAVKWIRKSAEKGNADAQSLLGLCYYNGEGVAKDSAEAVKWYRKAAEQGNAGAQTSLGKSQQCPVRDLHVMAVRSVC